MLDGEPCGDLATEVDHVRAGDDHNDYNLQALCGYHHRRKSAQEGKAASEAKRAEIGSRFRRGEAHPSDLSAG